VESQQRASKAIRAGKFRTRSSASSLKTRKGVTVFAEDEHVRHDAKLGGHAGATSRLQEGWRHGHRRQSSGINDGAAAVILASGEP